MQDTKRKKIEKILARMEASGELTPEAVVQAARDRRSPLHSFFVWDDKVAAHKHRLEQARELIRSVKTAIVVEGHRVVVPVYAHSAGHAAQGYRAIAKIKNERELAQQTLAEEIQRLLGILERARGVAHALGLAGRFEEIMRGVIDLRAKLDDAA